MKLMWISGLTVALIGVVGCGGTDTTTEPISEESVAYVAPKGVTATEVIIGTHTDLSGPIALYGVESVNGIRMRFDEANEAGGVHGRMIKFIAEDTQYEVPKSLIAANKLLYNDEIFAMLLALGTPNNNAVLTSQLKENVPNLFPLTGSIQMVEPFNRLKFTQRGIYFDEMRSAAKYFVGELGNERPCVCYIDNDYGQEILDGVNAGLEELGVELVAKSSHKTTETEFTAAILKFRDSECDVIFMGTVIRDTLIILDTVRTIGWEGVTWVGNNAAAGQHIPEMASGASEGYYAYAHMIPIYPDTETRQENIDWYNRFIELYGVKSDVPGMEGYRGADLVVTALEIAGPDLTLENFLSALESLSDYEGPFGYKLEFGPDDHKGVEESHLIRAEGGRWVIQDQVVSYEGRGDSDAVVADD